ncbi:hypothetical protein GDO81_002821 [Engystomops pustulosus]|uniref:Uncharacterized protein n=1 Tax=Engystomops pustulosus TaxID=76066 RepID=A0AAV7DR31_ENGPU|nr:hypothetical protein GDO81_002821 [Engystomops pustulosus]
MGPALCCHVISRSLLCPRRTLRHVPSGGTDKMAADADVCYSLVTFFRALFTCDITQQQALLSLLPASTRSMYTTPGDQATPPADDVMYGCLGFTIDRRPSSLDAAGTGVFVCRGSVPRGAVVSMYPGTCRPHESTTPNPEPGDINGSSTRIMSPSFFSPLEIHLSFGVWMEFSLMETTKGSRSLCTGRAAGGTSSDP